MPRLWPGPAVSPHPVTLKVSDPRRRPVVSGVSPRPPPRLPSKAAPGHLGSLSGWGRRGDSTQGFTPTLRIRARAGSRGLKCHLVAGQGRGEALGTGLELEKARKTSGTAGRGGVTAHKSPSPTLRLTAPAPRPGPRAMEGHSATPGRPLGAPEPAPRPGPRPPRAPAPARPDRKPPARFGGKPPLDAAHPPGGKCIYSS